MQEDSVHLFTITTSGYVPLTKNLLASLQAVGRNDAITVYCLDVEAVAQLKTVTSRYELIEVDSIPAFAEFMGAGFNRIVAMKYLIALQAMEAGRIPLYIDGDVVVLKNPIPLMTEQLKNHELVIQVEVPKGVCNAGFWMCKSTPKVIELFSKVLGDLQSGKLKEDQGRFNQYIAQYDTLSVCRLPVDQFVAGNLIFNNEYDKDNAYILHFNFTKGMQNKIEQMRDYGGIRDPNLLAVLD